MAAATTAGPTDHLQPTPWRRMPRSKSSVLAIKLRDFLNTSPVDAPSQRTENNVVDSFKPSVEEEGVS